MHIYCFHFMTQDAVSLIQRTQAEEKIIYCDNTGRDDQQVRGKVPAPPILLCRTDTYMVFKPAPFEPESGEKVIHVLYREKKAIL